jgi:putative addiction module component (TIGR02574 family)
MARIEPDISKLSPKERLRLLEQLWDSLAQSPRDVPMTEAQERELDRRLDEVDSGEVEGIPWDEVLRQLRERGK